MELRTSTHTHTLWWLSMLVCEKMNPLSDSTHIAGGDNHVLSPKYPVYSEDSNPRIKCVGYVMGGVRLRSVSVN